MRRVLLFGSFGPLIGIIFGDGGSASVRMFQLKENLRHYRYIWPSRMVFHALFTEPQGFLRSEKIEAMSIEDAEAELVARHPAATWWKVGIEMPDLPTPWTL